MKAQHIVINGLAPLVVFAASLTAIAAAAERVSTVDVTAGKPTEFGFQLSPPTVRHGAVAFRVTNEGAISHTFKICAGPNGGTANSCSGRVTSLLMPGASATMTYTFKVKGSYEYMCTVPGHAAAGMKGRLKVI
jgi:uncharacterized cupredoxin-like copper-binding protein